MNANLRKSNKMNQFSHEGKMVGTMSWNCTRWFLEKTI